MVSLSLRGESYVVHLPVLPVGCAPDGGDNFARSAGLVPPFLAVVASPRNFEPHFDISSNRNWLIFSIFVVTGPRDSAKHTFFQAPHVATVGRSSLCEIRA